MKLSKYYSLKKSTSNEIFSFTFPIIDIRNRKMTRRLDKSTTPRLGESTRQLPNSARRGVGEYDNFGPFLRASVIALYKKSSLYF
jgi:hypothetical protein